MIRLEHPEYLWLLVALAIVAGVYSWFFYWRRSALRQLGEYHLLQNMMADYSRVKAVIKFIIAVVAFILIVFGSANVQMGSATKKVSHSGIDIALVMDVSNSMLATDAGPNRLEAAKNAALKLTDLFPDSRIAIVSFAGSSATILPLTPDHAATQMILANLSVDYAQVQGTDLGEALTEGMHALPPNQNRYRAMVIFSDGEDHEHNVNEAIQQIVPKGIVVCTAIVGTAEGSEIPLKDSVTNAEIKRDSKGNVVVTKTNATLLKQVAEKTTGIFVSLSVNHDDFSPVNEIAKRLNSIEKSSFDEKIFMRYESRFQYFLLSALLLLLAETFLSNRKRKKNIPNDREKKSLT